MVYPERQERKENKTQNKARDEPEVYLETKSRQQRPEPPPKTNTPTPELRQEVITWPGLSLNGVPGLMNQVCGWRLQVRLVRAIKCC